MVPDSKRGGALGLTANPKATRKAATDSFRAVRNKTPCARQGVVTLANGVHLPQEFPGGTSAAGARGALGGAGGDSG